ncbi:MAG TPA: hypothetical protein VMB85_25875 [Bryobacteraceae bacterium]|nr:hypothetical protein [Bryobacteraceae bacterium]
MRTLEISESAKQATIDRAGFDAIMKKLLQAKRPITKQEISEHIKRFGSSSWRGAKPKGQQ